MIDKVGAFCPGCGEWFDMDDADVLGADDDKVFCPACNSEVDITWETKPNAVE